MTPRQRKRLGPLLVICVGAAMLSWAWDYSPDPVIDFGREVYVPWRIASAHEVLYRDIQYFNGPFSPYFNAGMLNLFGASLRTLKCVNALFIALLATAIYRLALTISDEF